MSSAGSPSSAASTASSPGSSSTRPLWELSLEGWNDDIAGGRGGSLVLVASAGATKGFPSISNYVAVKRGVVGMLNPMAAELGPLGIRVNALSPDQRRHRPVPVRQADHPRREGRVDR
ncbi:SDR family oxidoreductase [Pseudonocardia halophobica]|uniref:SDR family oxidoreductase n=1 Tax=Pseudonocardia halophobica TaxID=29401 RepID=UPI0018CC00E2